MSASTLAIGPNIYEHAISLNDTKLLSKLASTDFVAIEAKYHKDCYIQFRTRTRSSERACERFDGGDDPDKLI